MARNRLRAGVAISAFCAAAALTASAARGGEVATALHWRLAGPFRGGWAPCVAGVPDEPETFYFGAAGGGVWKTTDSGNTWRSIFSGRRASAISAIAVAPSDSRVVWAGTGLVSTRYDIAPGDGVYKSTDSGETWTSTGLSDTRAVGRIAIDPVNPNIVLVAAMGHIFGPNAERGIYRTTDGGRTWAKTLFVDPDTGAVDVTIDARNRANVYAATWQARNFPWLSYFQPVAGPGSALHKSTDGGVTWRRLSGGGWPATPVGRIGIALAGARIYACVDAKMPAGSGAPNSAAGLWRSDDAGGTWTRVSADSSLGSSYMGHVFIDPANDDTVYGMGQSIRRSTDGGRTFQFFKGAPGGDDYHFLWINPSHPDHMITGCDQGAVVTVNGGATWSSWYNQPTAQVYHVETDDRFPYRIYTGQQDSGTISIASRSDYGQLTFREWHPVGGDERDYDIPDPRDPSIVYASGLGGSLARYDDRTGQAQQISPWPLSTYGKRPFDLKFRYTWITPIAVSKNPYALYFGAQSLERSTDQGQHWTTVSPDLSRKQKGATGCDGLVTLENAAPCGAGVIYSISVSPRDGNEIWVGTDDGLVRVTRDGGATWADVTPPDVRPWQKVATVDASALASGTCYVAVDAQRLDDFTPHVYRTHDGGRTWTAISAGLPSDDFVDVVRSDPKQSGLLFAGTGSGVWYSADDGDSWHSLQNDLPAAWVRDLTIHGDDLIAGTQGRAIWILDDVSPLRQQREASASTSLYLFTPSTAVRWRGNENKDTPLPPETPVGENAPEGAILDYIVPAGPSAPLVLTIRDSAGAIVRRISSDDPPESLNARQYFADRWLPRRNSLDARPGVHRFVWDLRTKRPVSSTYDYSIAATKFDGTTAEPRGLFVLPGAYTAELQLSESVARRALAVVADPRSTATPAELAAQKRTCDASAASLATATNALAEIAFVRKQIDALGGRRDVPAETAASISALAAPVREISDALTGAASDLAELQRGLLSADRAPTEPQLSVAAGLGRVTVTLHDRWRSLRTGEIARIDRLLSSAGLPGIAPPAGAKLPAPEMADSDDVP